MDSSRLSHLLARIADPATPIAELEDALGELPEAATDAPFWTAIADDERYSLPHRRIAALQLVRRHVARGTSLADLAKLLGPAAWLRASDLDIVTALGGKIPVRWTSEDTVFVIRVLPGPPGPQAAIYLRVSGHVALAAFRALLDGRPGEPVVGESRVLEVGTHLG